MSQYVSKNLLDYLTESIGCRYLSDLHHKHLHSAILYQLSRIRPEDYSLGTWIDAIEYILDLTCMFTSSQEAYNFLCHKLSRKRGSVTKPFANKFHLESMEVKSGKKIIGEDVESISSISDFNSE
ncbi:hypothetical protein [Anaerotignum sp.]|uniref:hypothetical protein n=1 Tax=Anaerotignum sp. TaxID=2039241 RepID=UPI0028A606A8|nr:hypothetical protein [Anaerotignum sp.]